MLRLKKVRHKFTHQPFSKCLRWKCSVCSEKELNVGETAADAFVQEGISSRMQLVQIEKRKDVSERVTRCVAKRTMTKSVSRKMDKMPFL